MGVNCSFLAEAHEQLKQPWLHCRYGQQQKDKLQGPAHANERATKAEWGSNRGGDSKVMPSDER